MFSDISVGPNGKPDLNGVWQVMNRANYNLEAHSASAAMQLVEGPVVPLPHPDILALGTVGSVPAGLSVVEGGKIPYKKSALKIRNKNKADWLNRDPEIKCYLPGVQERLICHMLSKSFKVLRLFFLLMNMLAQQEISSCKIQEKLQ